MGMGNATKGMCVCAGKGEKGAERTEQPPGATGGMLSGVDGVG